MYSRIHFGERMGTGFKRMKDICKAENTPYPKIEYTDIHFYTAFRQSREYLKMAGAEEKAVTEVTGKVTERLADGLVERLVERLVEKLAESQKKILDLAKINPYTSKKELSDKIGISTTAIDKNIAKLKQKGLLKRIGPDKGGYWKILKNAGIKNLETKK